MMVLVMKLVGGVSDDVGGDVAEAVGNDGKVVMEVMVVMVMVVMMERLGKVMLVMMIKMVIMVGRW